MFHLLVEFFGDACYQSALTFHDGSVPVTFDFKAQNFFGLFRHMGCSWEDKRTSGLIVDLGIFAYSKS
jgi:hypothetical protein